MSEPLKEQRVYRVFQKISDSYDTANRRISLGMQTAWKKMLIRHLVTDTPAGARVLDVCCGTGDITLMLAKRRVDLTVEGLDFSPAMLAIAQKKAKGRKNVRFRQGNAMRLPYEDDYFSAVCISFGLRNTADYGEVLAEMKRVLKPGGFLYCLDSFVPDHPLVYPFYDLYFRRIMPLLGGGRRYREEYRWLYQSTKRFLRRSQLESLYRKLGLREVSHKSRMCGACVLVLGRK